MIDIDWIRKNPEQTAVQIEALIKALKPFAEKPTEQMDLYPCHYDICTKEECVRCGRAIAAYNILKYDVYIR